MSKRLSTRLWISPVGQIAIGAEAGMLHFLRLLDPGETMTEQGSSVAVIDETIDQLEAWFDHRLQNFDLPLLPAATSRGDALRSGIASVPYGEVASYGEVARRIGSGPRAVGQACRRNPFTIVIPCHRIVGAGQTLGYYSAGEGLATKQWLLDHERNAPAT